MNAPARAFVADVRGRLSDGPYSVRVARTLEELMQAVAVRAVVYMAGQACAYDEEYDGNDFAGSTHLVLRCGPEPVGVARLRWFADFAKLERLAIRPDHRGLPRLLMLARAAVALAERKGYRTLIGHASDDIAPFWRRYFGARRLDGRTDVVFSQRRYTPMRLPLHPPADALNLESDPMMLLRPEGDWDRPGVLERSS